MTWQHNLVLFGAAAIAGMVNSVAGGGTLLTFPALLSAGFDAVIANATSTVALWPGQLSSLWGYRKELGRESDRHRAAGDPEPAGRGAGRLAAAAHAAQLLQPHRALPHPAGDGAVHGAGASGAPPKSPCRTGCGRAGPTVRLDTGGSPVSRELFRAVRRIFHSSGRAGRESLRPPPGRASSCSSSLSPSMAATLEPASAS